MTEPISDQQLDLDQIQARANAATDGPWDVKAHTHGASGCRCLSCDDPAVGFTVDHTKALDCDERVAARSADGELNDFRRPLGSCSEGPLLTFADASFAARAREDVPALAAEVRRLRDRVAELEAYAYGCDAEGCVLPHSSWCDAAKKTAAANQGCTCGRPWTGHPQPHAMHCWTVNPPRAEVEEMRKRIAELSAVAASVPPGASVRPSQPSGVSESAQSPTGAPTGPLKPSVARSHNYERMEIARAELDKGFTDQEWAVGRIVCPEGFSCASHPLALFQPTKRGRLPVHRHETFGTPCPGSGQKPTTPPLKLRKPATGPAEDPTPADEFTGTQPCGHDDYHDPHPWADRPGVWCPGIGYDDEAAEETHIVADDSSDPAPSDDHDL